MSAEDFERRERALLGQRYQQLYAAPGRTAARGVTVSALRTTPEAFAAQAGLALTPSPFCRRAFLVREGDFKPGRHPYHHAGVFYSQEPSAASAAPLLGVRPGMRVLDLCAAPGGKSSQLAAALRGRGVLVSNEIVASRAEILKNNLERMGVQNAVILNETPARIAAALPAFFDRVLVDAPCSGEGMFRKEPAALAQHSEALVRQCAALGAEILNCAAEALAPGGRLLLSTCTFAPEEDEGQAAAFLARHPEFTLVDALDAVDYTFGSSGEANRTGGLPLDVEKVRRIWPCQGGEGHFMALFVKEGEPRALPQGEALAPEEEIWLAEAAAGAGKKAGRAVNRGRKENAPQAAFAQSLAAWRAFAKEYFPTLVSRAAAVYGGSVLLPAAFPRTGLHLLRSGVFAGHLQKDRFLPEHQLFAAYGTACANIEPLALDDPRVEDYLAGREIAALRAAPGWCCVTVDGFPLGGGKVSGGRVKNHYPKALRILSG